jgi:hypothetical protein
MMYDYIVNNNNIVWGRLLTNSYIWITIIIIIKVVIIIIVVVVEELIIIISFSFIITSISSIYSCISISISSCQNMTVVIIVVHHTP